MKIHKIATWALLAASLTACTSMAQRDRLVDPQTWTTKPGSSSTKSLNQAIDHCYMVYMKGRNISQLDQASKEYRRCMDFAGYQEKPTNEK